MTVAPWALSAGIYWTMVAGTAGSECPFVPVNQTARDQINALVGMNSVKRKAAFSSLDEATYLQLLRDTDDGTLTETWLAAIPANIRAAFGAWLGPVMGPALFIAASWLGAIVGVGMMLAGRASAMTKLPFGLFAGSAFILWPNLFTRVF